MEGLIAWDTETCLFKPGLQAPPLVCVSWASRCPSDQYFPSAKGLTHWTDSEDLIEHILTKKSVAHNTPYDLAVAAAQYPSLLPKIFEAFDGERLYDTETREKLLDIAEGCYDGWMVVDGEKVKRTYSLAALAKRYLGIHLEKTDVRLRFHEVRNKPLDQWPDAFVNYAVDDADVLLDIFQKQEERAASMAVGFQGNNPLVDQHRQFRGRWWIHLMRCWGLRTDGKKVLAFENHLKRRFKEVEGILLETGLLRPSKVRDTKKAKALILELLGESGVKLTDTGKKKLQSEDWTKKQAIEAGYIKVDDEACRATDDPRLISYTEYSHLIKLHSTYVRSLWNGTEHPIHPYFEHLRETGRTSASDPNTQNLPREDGARQCYVPRPGNVFVGCDYDKAELHVLSQLCLDYLGESKLAEALCGGFDPHLSVGAQILGIPYEEALDRYKKGDKEVRQARQMAKAANFGYPGGLGAASFMVYAKNSYGVIITEKEARKLKADWLASWPEMKSYFGIISKYTEDTGKCDYFQPRSGRIRGRCPFTVACNTGFQGGAADGAKAAGYEIARRQYTVPSSGLYGTRTVNFVHDEFILEAREEKAHEAAIELSEVMVEQFNKFVPDVPVSATPAIMRCWEKDAEPVWKNGRLVPWEREAA